MSGTASISTFIAAARDTYRAPGTSRKRRIVIRMDPSEVKRLDTLLKSIPVTSRGSRASLIRAFISFGLQVAEQTVNKVEQEDAP